MTVLSTNWLDGLICDKQGGDANAYPASLSVKRVTAGDVECSFSSAVIGCDLANYLCAATRTVPLPPNGASFVPRFLDNRWFFKCFSGVINSCSIAKPKVRRGFETLQTEPRTRDDG